jgi:hypothetical protein
MFGNTRTREFMLAISEGLEWAQNSRLLVRDLAEMLIFASHLMRIVASAREATSWACT